MASEQSIISIERIERNILLIRGQKVMLDSNLAKLYAVKTKALNQAVKRNIERFPSDFMFCLDENESDALRSQFVTSNSGRGGRRYFPFVFTEQGVAMLSTVLKSKRAIQVNIEIIRTFVRLRQWLSTHKELAKKLEELEKKYDTQFKVVFDAIRQLMASELTSKRRIGFRQNQCRGRHTKSHTIIRDFKKTETQKKLELRLPRVGLGLWSTTSCCLPTTRGNFLPLTSMFVMVHWTRKFPVRVPTALQVKSYIFLPFIH